MAVYEIPLTPQAQKFVIKLGSIDYQLTLSWNDIANSWNLDVADANEVPIVSGIAVVSGTDLLGQYFYLGFEGALYANSLDNPFIPPTFENLGDNGKIYFVTSP